MASPSTASATAPTFDPVLSWLTVALLVLLGAIAFLDRQVISLLTGPIKADLHISDMRISLLQGFAFALLYSTCAVPIGYAVDRHSRRLVIFAGVLIWGIAASASGLARNFEGLLAARIFVGMGEAALAPAAYSILSDCFDRRRLSLALSIYAIGASLGASGALIGGSYLIGWVGTGLALPIVGLLHPWQTVLVLTGLPGLACCFLIFLIPEPRRTPAQTTNTGSWIELARFLVARKTFFACHFAGFGCMMAMAYASLSWLPSVLIRGFGWPIQAVGLALGAISMATSIGGLLFNGFAVDAWFARGQLDAHLRYYRAAVPLIAACALAAALVSNIWAYLILMTLPLVLLNFAGVAAAAVQIATPPELRGRISALYLMFVSLVGLVIGPLLVAAIADRFVGPAHVQLALGIALAVLGPFAALFFTLGMAPMRRAVVSA